MVSDLSVIYFKGLPMKIWSLESCYVLNAVFGVEDGRS